MTRDIYDTMISLNALHAEHKYRAASLAEYWLMCVSKQTTMDDGETFNS